MTNCDNLGHDLYQGLLYRIYFTSSGLYNSNNYLLLNSTQIMDGIVRSSINYRVKSFLFQSRGGGGCLSCDQGTKCNFSTCRSRDNFYIIQVSMFLYGIVFIFIMWSLLYKRSSLMGTHYRPVVLMNHLYHLLSRPRYSD